MHSTRYHVSTPEAPKLELDLSDPADGAYNVP